MPTRLWCYEVRPQRGSWGLILNIRQVIPQITIFENIPTILEKGHLLLMGRWPFLQHKDIYSKRAALIKGGLFMHFVRY